MKSASRWFCCTDALWCTVSHCTDALWCTVSRTLCFNVLTIKISIFQHKLSRLPFCHSHWCSRFAVTYAPTHNFAFGPWGTIHYHNFTEYVNMKFNFTGKTDTFTPKLDWLLSCCPKARDVKQFVLLSRVVRTFSAKMNTDYRLGSPVVNWMCL
jgi:hypothetical protein